MARSASEKTMASSARDARDVDPIFRNALRYTLSPRESALLRSYLQSRVESLPPAIRRRAPLPLQGASGSAGKNEKANKEVDKGRKSSVHDSEADFNAATIRLAIRIFLGTYIGLKGVSLVTTTRRSRDISAAKRLNPNLRIALSLSLILASYRTLHRFLTRLRALLLTDPSAAAAGFRQRNPRVASALTSTLTPAIGASLAGLWLGVFPAASPAAVKGTGGGSGASRLRATIAVFAIFKAGEWVWDAADRRGLVVRRQRRQNNILTSSHKKMDDVKSVAAPLLVLPSWWGSWMLAPLAYAQLLHAFVFERTCFPAAFGGFVLGHSPEYVHGRPEGYPEGATWPATYDAVDALAEMAEIGWPTFTSPILHPKSKPLPTPTLAKVAPLTSSAHPLHSALSCAVLHPYDPSCSRVLLKHLLRSFPRMLRYNLLLHLLLSLPAIYKSLRSDSNSNTTSADNNEPKKQPPSLPKILTTSLRRATRTSLSLTLAIATAWSTLCLQTSLFPPTRPPTLSTAPTKPSRLPSRRFLLSGSLAGAWALLDARHGGRATAVYSARAATDSLFRVGVKRGWWKGVRAGDVWVFVVSMAVLGCVAEVEGGEVPAIGRWVVGKLQGVRERRAWGEDAEQNMVIEGEEQEEDGHVKRE